MTDEEKARITRKIDEAIRSALLNLQSEAEVMRDYLTGKRVPDADLKRLLTIELPYAEVSDVVLECTPNGVHNLTWLDRGWSCEYKGVPPRHMLFWAGYSATHEDGTSLGHHKRLDQLLSAIRHAEDCREEREANRLADLLLEAGTTKLPGVK